MTDDPRGFPTRAIHGSGGTPEGPLGEPVFLSSAWRFRTVDELARANAGLYKSSEYYTRYGNPNLAAFEERMAQLEETEASLAFSSGMAAISAVFLAYLKPGARLLVQSETYGGTSALIEELIIPWGVDVKPVALDDLPRLDDNTAAGAKLLYTESPTNPLCRIADLSAISKICKKLGIVHACDATFASPVNQRTHALGVDLVIQSATKYIGGHSDLLGGTVSGTRRALAPVETLRRRTGAVPDPAQAWRMQRSLATLALRVKRQNANAVAIAQFLSQCKEIEKVYYPGLQSHRDYDLACRQMGGFGGIVTFDVAGGEPCARAFAEALRCIAIAPSLGGVESTICPPIHTSHAHLSAEARRACGISEGALRLSVGIEDEADLLADLRRGLRAVSNC
jgi:cystathionine beta-lyase/cystathionine gamma-synthase